MNKETIDHYLELHERKRKSLRYYLENHGIISVIDRTFRHSWFVGGSPPLHGPGEFEPFTIQNFKITKEKDMRIIIYFKSNRYDCGEYFENRLDSLEYFPPDQGKHINFDEALKKWQAGIWIKAD